MTVTYLLTILVFCIAFILMAMKSLLKGEDRSTLTCSNVFGDGIDTSLCGTRCGECRQGCDADGRSSMG